MYSHLAVLLVAKKIPVRKGTAKKEWGLLGRLGSQRKVVSLKQKNKPHDPGKGQDVPSVSSAKKSNAIKLTEF